MMQRVADWHGEQAGKAYVDYQRSEKEAELAKFLRHVLIADKLWHGKSGEYECR